MKKIIFVITIFCVNSALLGSGKNCQGNESINFCRFRLTFPFSTSNLYYYLKSNSQMSSSQVAYNLVDQKDGRHELHTEIPESEYNSPVARAIIQTQKKDSIGELEVDGLTKCQKKSGKITCKCNFSSALFKAVKEQIELENAAKK